MVCSSTRCRKTLLPHQTAIEVYDVLLTPPLSPLFVAAATAAVAAAAAVGVVFTQQCKPVLISTGHLLLRRLESVFLLCSGVPRIFDCRFLVCLEFLSSFASRG